MSPWKKILRDYFSFTRRDRIGIMVLVFMIIFVAFMPVVMNRHRPTRFNDADSSWVVEIEKLKQKPKEYKPVYPQKHFTERSSPHADLFPFDPNTISEDELKMLGLRETLVQTILRYREKGGKFKKPADLEKVYGMHKDEFERLLPFVQVTEAPDNRYQRKPFTDTGFSKMTAANYKREYQPVEINSSDSTEWIALPGIASRYSKRILEFRERLGGFISIDQVGETFGLPDSTFQKIKPWLRFENSSLRKININTATIDEMKTHPYIRFSTANAIIAYREMHGPYKNIEEIKKIMMMTDAIFNKIAPYLTVL